MKLSARNQIEGVVQDVQKGATTAHVHVKISGGAVITSSITNESIEALDIKPGDKVLVVIKSSDVMIGKE